MKTLALPVLSAVAAVLSSGETHAQYFEARNAAMGGVGVASSDYLAAGWANPALLTRRGESDDFGILLPAF
ncbi:MAG: conjugal transfer protein TraF, partial [Planctomycetota bacterium]